MTVRHCGDCGAEIASADVELPCRACGGTRRDVVITPAPAEVRVSVLAPTVTVRTHLWVHWAQIAVERQRTAAVFRADALHKRHAGENYSESFNQEFQAAMVAVSAAAIAIDAFYGAVKPIINIPVATRQAWLTNGSPRHRQILETFKLGFSVNKLALHWLAELKWLFRLRDSAVHFEEQEHSFVPHPIGGNTAPEQVTYSAESAQRAVDLLLQVVDTCSTKTRKSLPRLKEEMDRMRPTIDLLIVRRASLL